MGELNANSVLWTPVGRLSFVKFFPPEKSKKKNPETGDFDKTWTASIVFDPEADEKTKKRFADIRKVTQMIIQDKFNGKKAGLKLPWRDGNEMFELDEKLYEIYEDKMYITVRSKNIEVVPMRKTGEKKGKAVLEPCTKNNFFSGCYGSATIRLFGFDNESRGVSASLQNMFLNKLGDPLGFSRNTAEEDFAEADDDEDFDIIDDEMMDEDQDEDEDEDDDDEDFVPRKKGKAAKKPEPKKKKSRSYDDDDF